jgi:hypothetical protein
VEDLSAIIKDKTVVQDGQVTDKAYQDNQPHHQDGLPFRHRFTSIPAAPADWHLDMHLEGEKGRGQSFDWPLRNELRVFPYVLTISCDDEDPTYPANP